MPSIATSSVRRSPSWRMSVPRMRRRHSSTPLVVVGIEPLVERPRLLHARPLVHSQDLELQQVHPAVADHDLVGAGDEPP